jgi:hypothetical protein
MWRNSIKAKLIAVYSVVESEIQIKTQLIRESNLFVKNGEIKVLFKRISSDMPDKIPAYQY